MSEFSVDNKKSRLTKEMKHKQHSHDLPLFKSTFQCLSSFALKEGKNGNGGEKLHRGNKLTDLKSQSLSA